MASPSTSFRLFFLALMIATGAFDTLGTLSAIQFTNYKINRSLLREDNPNTSSIRSCKYALQNSGTHITTQVAAMFLGQSIALLVYYIHKYKYPETHRLRAEEQEQLGKSMKINKLLFAIPALCDCGASTLQLFALNFIASSVYQMMRGGTIITTFMFSILILKIKAQRHQYLGSAFAFVGIIIVGASSVIFNSEQVNTEPGLQIAGYFMLIASLFLNGFQFVFQQSLFDKYHIQPLQLVGFQGVFALTFISIVISILTFIPCSFGPNGCAYNSAGDPFIQRADSYFTSIAETALLLTFSIVGVFTIMAFNVCGASITKYINALARSVCDVCRTVLIWLVGIIVTLTLGETHENYKWESLVVGQIFMQLGGFVLLIVGNLVYNQIIRFPCLKTNQQDEPLIQKSYHGISAVKNL